MKYALDCSNFTGVLDDHTLAALQLLGTGYHSLSHLMAGTQIPSICNQQVQAVRAKGWTTDVYVQLETATDLTAAMQDAKYAVEDVEGYFKTGSPERLFLALEAVPPGHNPSDTFQWIDAAKKAALKAGFKRIGIYTRKSWWDFYVSTDVLFSTMPLWYANYNDKMLTPRVWREEGFGGWYTPAWKQYRQNEPINGQLFDLNVSHT